MKRGKRPSLLFGLVVIAIMLSVIPYLACLPGLVALHMPGVNEELFSWLLYAVPIFVISSGALGLKVYGENKSLAWLMLLMAILVYAALFWLNWRWVI